MKPVPTLLLILDGWGLAPAGPGNAVTRAGRPAVDRLLAAYPSTTLACSGRAVGLPDGFMGNSEVGHMNIGAGRVVYQDMTRIDMAVETGQLAKNPVLADLAATVKASGGRLHLMGLVSDGGVHSHIHHLKALVDTFAALGLTDILIDAFLDAHQMEKIVVEDVAAALAVSPRTIHNAMLVNRGSELGPIRSEIAARQALGIKRVRSKSSSSIHSATAV